MDGGDVAQGDGHLAAVGGVAHLTMEVEAAAQQRQGRLVVVLIAGQHAGRAGGVGQHRRRHSGWGIGRRRGGDETPQPLPPLGEQAAEAPEATQRRGQPQGADQSLRPLQPIGQRRPQVIGVGRQPPQPLGLLLLLQKGRGPLGQSQVVGQMARRRGLGLAALGQLLQGVLAQHDQQPEARLVLLIRGQRPDHALVGQRGQAGDECGRGLARRRVVANSHGRAERERPVEHPQPGKEALLVRREQAVAPVNRPAQGALPLADVAQLGRQIEGAGQLRQKGRRGQQPHPRRGQFDGQGQAVEPGADGGDGGGVFGRQGEAGARGAGALDEQGYGRRGQQFGRGRHARRGQAQRGNGVVVLAIEAQQLAASDQQRQPARPAQQMQQVVGGVEHLLEVVEDEQQAARR